MSERIGFGGGCHWCTEAVFQAIVGVAEVRQGWIATTDDPARFSEAVLLRFDPTRIALRELIDAHLHTHASTSAHPMRDKYRSAVYVMNNAQAESARRELRAARGAFEKTLVTEVLRFGTFRASSPRYRNYYARRPEAPFCRRHIAPKLRIVAARMATRPVERSQR
ncbi:peptide-methionine (S)-S-oxide reductase [uncultured Abyssibacter sp.]|uniref:peptide-methionine (S)-S-oxide reductase n=1 Tax=uncultured Abyssibacter sp. TaxID=2320202 RepID=UPI0032B218E4